MAKGFNRPPMGGGGNMMAQLKKLQEQMEQAQARLAEETVTGTSGGGAIKVIMTGDQHCKAVEIAPELLQEVDADMLQDMLLAAINQALELSRQKQEELLGPLAGGLGGLGGLGF